MRSNLAIIPVSLVWPDSALVRSMLWGLFVLLAAILLARALYEPTQLQITRTSLPGPDRGSRSTGGLRVALLSDLHAEWLRLKPEQIARALAGEDFDLILFAGDLTGRHHRPDLAQPWLEALAGLNQRLAKACYAVPGNHDSPASLDLLRQAGFKILSNDSCIVPDRSGQSWLLIGLDILKKGRPDFGQALARAPAGGLDIPVQRRLVLAHNPDTVLQIPAGQAGFFLAGHFHGGQIFLPFHLEFFILRREKLGRMGYHKGSFALEGLYGYISRGLGSVLFPLRLGSRPELAILELKANPLEVHPI